MLAEIKDGVEVCAHVRGQLNMIKVLTVKIEKSRAKDEEKKQKELQALGQAVKAKHDATKRKDAQAAAAAAKPAGNKRTCLIFDELASSGITFHEDR